MNNRKNFCFLHRKFTILFPFEVVQLQIKMIYWRFIYLNTSTLAGVTHPTIIVNMEFANLKWLNV